MKGLLIIASIFLAHLCVCYSTRINSRKFTFDSDDHIDSIPPQELPVVPSTQNTREERKLIFVNNVAYDLSDYEMEQYLDTGILPNMQKVKRKPDMDSLLAALNSGEEDHNIQMALPEINDLGIEDYLLPEKTDAAHQHLQELNNPGDPFTENTPDHTSIKASRFVADTSKQHLIETVNEEELDDLRKAATTTTPSPSEKVATDSPEETSTIRYEYTKVNALTFIWNEVLNLGDLLGREMITTVSGTLSYLWETMVHYVYNHNRRRRAIQDMSGEM